MTDFIIPSLEFKLYGTKIARENKFVYFIIDANQYAWFEISSLCDAFNLPLNTFEAFSSRFETLPGQGDTFISELDIFSTPCAERQDFIEWYLNVAFPEIYNFTGIVKLSNEKMHIQRLNEMLTHLVTMLQRAVEMAEQQQEKSKE